MSTLKDLLLDRRDAIAARWQKGALDIYARDAAVLFGREKDPFANPVGHALRTGTEAVLKGLASGEDVEKLAEALAEIVQMRAVQEVSPSKAIAFVFLLKEAVRAELGSQANDPGVAAALLKLDGQVDRLALATFDHYVKCRERVYELRVNEVKRSFSGLMGVLERRQERDTPASHEPDNEVRES